MNVLFLGGDIRQKYASDYLNKNGICSKAYQDFNIRDINNEIQSTSVIALPLPISNNSETLNCTENINLEDLLNQISDDQIIFGGQIPNSIYISKPQCRIFDYLLDESFAIQNALLSAEGAIFFAKDKIKKSIHGLNIAILGFGRIGKILSYLLNVQGAKITIYTRKDLDRTWSRLLGYNTRKIENSTSVDRLYTEQIRFDLIFNTIPANVLTEKFLLSDFSDSIIIDLASHPYGINESLVEKHKLQYFHELGIPGRYAPQTAGEIIGNTIINILSRENCL